MRTANSYVLGVPINSYQTKDGYVAIVASPDPIWKRLAEAIGKPEFGDDPRYATRAARIEHREDVDGMLGPWVKERTTDEVVKALEKAGVPCGPVQSTGQIAADPHLHHRKMFHEIEHPVAGKVKVIGSPMHFSAAAGSRTESAPLLGQHNEDILCGMLGHKPEELTSWRAAGVI